MNAFFASYVISSVPPGSYQRIHPFFFRSSCNNLFFKTLSKTLQNGAGIHLCGRTFGFTSPEESNHQSRYGIKRLRFDLSRRCGAKLQGCHLTLCCYFFNAGYLIRVDISCRQSDRYGNVRPVSLAVVWLWLTTTSAPLNRTIILSVRSISPKQMGKNYKNKLQAAIAQ